MVPSAAAERFPHAMAHAQRDLVREAITECLLRAVEILLDRDPERQRRADFVDASGDEPMRGERLRTLHVPARGGARPQARAERVVHPFAGETRVPERELAFDGDKVRGAVRRNGRTLARVQPASVRQRRADAKADKRRDATAEDNVRIMERAKSPAVLVYYDVGNSNRNGFDVPKEIRWLGKSRICQMHLKDKGYIGDGPIDFTAVMKAIADIGYAGFANLETSAPSGSIEDDMRRNLKAVREYWAKARNS